MLKLARLTLLAVAGLSTTSGLALAAEKGVGADKPAATVNGVAIPQALIDMRVKLFAAARNQPDTPELRNYIKEELINVELINQAAKKSGLDKQPDIALQMQAASQAALANAYVQDYLKNHPISEDTIKSEYDNLKTQHALPEYRVSHILVATKAEADAIEAQLKKKAKFEELAATKSKDAMSAAQGGSLGWTAPSNLVAPFAAAMMKLKKGQVSAPVQTQFGWHIIRLDETRELTLDQIKPELMQRLQDQAVQKAIADLRKDAKIEQ